MSIDIPYSGRADTDRPPVRAGEVFEAGKRVVDARYFLPSGDAETSDDVRIVALHPEELEVFSASLLSVRMGKPTYAELSHESTDTDERFELLLVFPSQTDTYTFQQVPGGSVAATKQTEKLDRSDRRGSYAGGYLAALRDSGQTTNPRDLAESYMTVDSDFVAEFMGRALQKAVDRIRTDGTPTQQECAILLDALSSLTKLDYTHSDD